MRSGDEGAAPAVRLWWAVPLGLVLVTAVVFVSVVLPALASGPSVPSELVVHRSPAPAASTSTSPPPSPTPTPTPTRSTTVVRPEQPVVRDSDDRHEREGPGG
jgi:hypothetical protein